MDQGRRSFFKKLAGAAAAALTLEVIDPERLLWVPGKKTIIDLGATKRIIRAEDAAVAEIRREYATKALVTEVSQEQVGMYGRQGGNLAPELLRRHVRQARVDFGRYKVDTVANGRRSSATFDSDWVPTGHRNDPAGAQRINQQIFTDPALAITSGSGPRYVDMASDYRSRPVWEGDIRRAEQGDFEKRFKVTEG